MLATFQAHTQGRILGHLGDLDETYELRSASLSSVANL